MVLYAITIFLGSFLLFQVQPLLGKQLIPHFGGSPAVWTTCMLFFQVALIAGYGYAHGLTLLGRRAQLCLHLLLLGLALAFLPPDLTARLTDASTESPVTAILWLLTVTAGLPFVLLSASAPLTQYWFMQGRPTSSPWRLYALSNAGSLLALLSYPVLIEPRIDISGQSHIWGWGFVFYLALCALVMTRSLLQKESSPATAELSEGSDKSAPRISPWDALFWLACSAFGSATLLAVTNQICQQVATVPFLWILPLAAYLVTFIACFASRRAYSLPLRGVFVIVATAFTMIALTAGNGFGLPAQLLLFIGVLIACCMICHGELVRLQPHSSSLTAYYLVIAAGGAVGGAFISLLAPLLFTSFVEMPILVAADISLLLTALFRARDREKMPHWLLWLGGTALAGQLLFTGTYIKVLNNVVVESCRNFYGTLKVFQETDALGAKLSLKHGNTLHGSQYQDANLRDIATTYYGPYTAAGLALRLHPNRLNMAGSSGQRRLRAGFIGLGVGTLASYGITGDTFRFYELDSAVIRLAQERFTFLGDSHARIELVPGDARLNLAREARQGGKQQFDVLVVDAFSNDSIPVHLVTKEAVELYLGHLRPDGLLLFHVSNILVDLLPVLASHAEAFGLPAVSIVTPDEPGMGRREASWAVLTANKAFLENDQVRSRAKPLPSRQISWTDSFAGIWQVLK